MSGWTALLSPPVWWAFFGALLATLVFWLLVDWLYWRRRLQTRVVEWEEVVTSASQELQSNLAATTKRLQVSEAALGTTKTALQTASSDVALARQQIADQEAVVASLRTSYATEINALRNERDHAHNNLATARTLLEESVAHGANMQNELGALQASHRAVQADVAQFSSERDQAHTQAATLRNELAASIAQAGLLQNQLNNLHATYTTAQADITQLKSERDQAIGDLQSVTQELESSYANARDLRIDLESLRTKHGVVQADADRLSTELSSNHAALQGQHEQAQSTIFTLRNAADADRETIVGLRTQIGVLQQELAHAKLALSQTSSDLATVQRKGDPLVQINGIGPVYQQRLNEAGIRTFAELAEKHADHLHAIIQPEDWQQLDYATWISEARIFAAGGKIERERRVRQRRVFRSARDRLERIEGLSAQDEQRLWAAGILTFDQLARRSEAEIRQLLAIPADTANVRGWIQEARRLAQLRAELVEYSFEADDPRRTITELVAAEGDELARERGNL